MTTSRGSVLDEGMKDVIATMMPILDERQRRIFLSVLTENLGWGSASDISEFTGISLPNPVHHTTQGERAGADVDEDDIIIRDGTPEKEFLLGGHRRRLRGDGSPRTRCIRRNGDG